MPRAKQIEIDHIDPRWKEGRDYQLVCGLDCPLNYREEDWKKNTAKSNKFLPWRWCRDEIGVVPEEPGDLALFLVKGEWVLLEFLTPEWFEAAKRSHAASHVKRDSSYVIKQWETLKANPELIEARNRKIQKTRKEKGIKSGFSLRYKCLVCGIESNLPGVLRAQRSRGIDPTPENRIQLTFNEAII